ncbi:hypothetical protein [Kitasatospora mediocidica]|uniref:hypothetical protein n=1 Tax=Kitasatospora mediocidica TaxID=58352 RepID=UPI0012F74B03|nr:hypothetical protein [Kitasatospora mediocidica]
MTLAHPVPEERRCKATLSPDHPTRPGERCSKRRVDGEEYCWSHGPDGPPPDHRRCKGNYRPSHKTYPGERCRQPVMRYQTVCIAHGGRLPNNLLGARRRATEERCRKLVTMYGRKIETTATEALLDEVQWTAGHVAWLRERVQELEAGTPITAGPEHPLVWGTVRRKTGGQDWGETEEAGPTVWVKLYQQERAHLVKVCGEAIRAGIEERRVKLAESQGALVAQAIRKILDDLDLTAEQAARVHDIVPRHLRAIAG